MKIYRYGLTYDEDMRQIELSVYGIFKIDDKKYSPGFLVGVLNDILHMRRRIMDFDAVVSLNAKHVPSGIYCSQSGASVYGLFDLRLLALYSLLSFRDMFVYVRYYAASGRIVPSEKDDEMCRDLERVYASLSATLIDFLLVNKTGCYSYMRSGRLGFLSGSKRMAGASACLGEDADHKNENSEAA